MTLFIDAIMLFLRSRWSPVAFIITAMGIIYANFLGVMEKVAELIDGMDSLVRPVVQETGVSVSLFGFMNYIMPLDLLIAYMNLYLPFLVVCCVIRFTKSWIPLIGT